MNERVKNIELGKVERLLTVDLVEYADNLSDYSRLEELEQVIDQFNDSVARLEMIIRSK